MNPGLRYLLRKKPVGWGRAIRRRLKGKKGVLLALGVLAALLLFIGPQLSLAAQVTAESVAETAAAVRLWGPPALMLMALFGMSSGVGLLFRPSEIDFLFPAPVGRRELLLYHVLGKLSVVLLSSLWVAIFTLRWAPCWYGGFVGLFFGLSFLQLTSQLASLVLSTFSVRANKRVRQLVVIGLLALAVLGALVARQQMSAQTAFAAAAGELVGSTGVTIAAAPARVFVEIFASETVGAFAVWTAGGLAILIVLFVLIVLLDVAYAEGAVRSSRKVQERLRRMRSGGGPLVAPTTGVARFSLPAAPWLGGAGPVVWRQGIEALRNLRGIVLTALLTVGMPILFVVMSASSTVDAGPGGGPGTGPMGFFMVIVMTVFMTQNLALDFRRDLDRMAYLKSLPLPPVGVAFGQILPGILVFTILQAVAIGVLALALGVAMPWPTPMLLLLLPFNWLSMALDNLLFLLFPYRFAPKEAGNVQFMGRAMMVMMAKMLALMAALAAAALIGWLSWWLGGESMVLAGLGATAVLSVEATALTYRLGRVFSRFDVTVDVPG